MKTPNTSRVEPTPDRGWLWAVRISLLVSALACVPLLVESFLFVIVLAAFIVLGGLLFRRPGRRTFVAAVVVGGLAFLFLGLPEIFQPVAYSRVASLIFALSNLSLALTATEAQSRLGGSEAPPPAGNGDPRWLTAVRILTVISTVPAWVIIALAYAVSLRGPCAERTDLQYLVFLPAFLPYLDILWHLRARTRARGVGLAAAVAGLGWLIPVAVPALVMWDSIEEIRPWAIVFAILQLGLFIAALGTYTTMHPENRDSWQIVRGYALLIGYALMGVVIMGLASGPLTRGGRSAHEASAVASLRTLLTAEITYASDHGGSFSSSLAALGGGRDDGSNSPLSGQGRLIDDLLASGKKDGYRFIYTPGTPDVAGQLKSFGVIAQPLEYGVTGCRNFYGDQTGVIRTTREDRPASAQDPPLAG